MAINPDEITTVQVNELPPDSLHPEDNLMHEVSGVLSRHTVQQLVDYLRSQSTSYQYEVKFIRAPNNQYIADNFDMLAGPNQGLGKEEGLWNGWAICNGNNGTDNYDGQTLIGYGPNYPVVGNALGEKNHVLSLSEIPSHSHTINNIKGYNNSFGTNGFYDRSQGASSAAIVSDNAGGGLAHNNMQPSVVILMIMKL